MAFQISLACMWMVSPPILLDANVIDATRNGNTGEDDDKHVKVGRLGNDPQGLSHMDVIDPSIPRSERTTSEIILPRRD